MVPITARRSGIRSAVVSIAAGLLLGGAWLSVSLYFLFQARSADSIRSLADRVRIDLLESRRREKDFLLRSLTEPAFYSERTTPSLRQYGEAMNRLQKESEELSARVPGNWALNLKGLLAGRREYDEGFRELIACYLRLGFKDSGLEGSWEAGYKDLERVIEATGSAALQRDLLEMRCGEKEFLLRGSEVSLQSLHRCVERLRETTRAAMPASGVQDRLDRYLKDLVAVHALEREIGFDENLGLQGRYRTAAHQIEPIVTEVVDRATGEYRAASGRLVGGFLIASVLLSGLLSTTFFLTRTARKRSRDLSESAFNLSRSNSELQQFAYVASHDLQEPLRAVAGCVQLLQQRAQGKLDERCDELIRHAVEGSLRMQTLIEDLLTLSRVGTQARTFVSADSGKVLQAALDNLEVAVRESGATVTHDRMPTVTMDPTQILLVFQNLLSNAIKFRGPNIPVIHIGAERQENAWRFFVRDNGIGIEPQYFERIFRIFQRLHTRREYPGSGIGLAVCEKILLRHHGKIWLESELNRGTTFFFTLPDLPEGP
jgi:signal transduction histidine kinase